MKNSKHLILSLLLVLTSSCAYFDTEEESQSVTPPAEVKTVTVATPHGTHSQPTAHAPSHSSGHAEVHSTEPAQALQWLKNGNTRFKKSRFRNDGATQKDVARLSKGQTPHSIVLSCSDSRVPPEVVFDQKLGEIFTVRTAGQVIEPSAIASMEYAVEHLGSRNLVVMGHTNCGAVKAAFGTLDGADAGSENLNKLVHDIHPRIEKFKGAQPSEHFEKEGWANVQGVIQDISARSKILGAKIKSGEIKINAALYHLDTGVVEFQ
jgi:carbonic anhydrase